MSRRLAATVLAVVVAACGALAAEPTSPEALATRALDSALKHLQKQEHDAARKDFDAAKQAYMHLFVHDRSASHALMKTMKSWVEERRAKRSTIDSAAFGIIDTFDAWVRERDTLARSVVNLGHNSPDWK
jgi:ABC-type transporter MlaC component